MSITQNIIQKLGSTSAATTAVVGGVTGLALYNLVARKKSIRVRMPIHLQISLDEIAELVIGGGGHLEYDTPHGPVHVWLTGIPTIDTDEASDVEPNHEPETS